MRSGEVNVNPCTAGPAAPHVQSEGLGRIELHLLSEGGGETEMTTRWPAQPDEELAGLVPDVALHRGRHRWRRHGHHAASSPSPPTAAATSATPLPLPLVAGSATAGSWEGGTR